MSTIGESNEPTGQGSSASSESGLSKALGVVLLTLVLCGVGVVVISAVSILGRDREPVEPIGFSTAAAHQEVLDTKQISTTEVQLACIETAFTVEEVQALVGQTPPVDIWTQDEYADSLVTFWTTCLTSEQFYEQSSGPGQRLVYEERYSADSVTSFLDCRLDWYRELPNDQFASIVDASARSDVDRLTSLTASTCADLLN